MFFYTPQSLIFTTLKRKPSIIMWIKETMLATNIFSFSPNVFNHTIPYFHDPEKEAFEHNADKGNDTGNQYFLLLPPMFSTTQSPILTTLKRKPLNIIRIKEMMLATNIFSFSPNVFYHTIPYFHDPEKEAFEHNVDKGNDAGNQYFPLFPQYFLPHNPLFLRP